MRRLFTLVVLTMLRASVGKEAEGHVAGGVGAVGGAGDQDLAIGGAAEAVEAGGRFAEREIAASADVAGARVHRPSFTAGQQVAEPCRVAALARGGREKVSSTVRISGDPEAVCRSRERVGGPRGFVKEIPAPQDGEAEPVELDIAADPVFVPSPLYVLEEGQARAVAIELQRGGERGAILRIAAVTGAQAVVRLREQRDVVILQAVNGIHQVQSAGDGEAGIVVVVQAARCRS